MKVITLVSQLLVISLIFCQIPNNMLPQEYNYSALSNYNVYFFRNPLALFYATFTPNNNNSITVTANFYLSSPVIKVQAQNVWFGIGFGSSTNSGSDVAAFQIGQGVLSFNDYYFNGNVLETDQSRGGANNIQVTGWSVGAVPVSSMLALTYKTRIVVTFTKSFVDTNSDFTGYNFAFTNTNTVAAPFVSALWGYFTDQGKIGAANNWVNLTSGLSIVNGSGLSAFDDVILAGQSPIYWTTSNYTGTSVVTTVPTNLPAELNFNTLSGYQVYFFQTNQVFLFATFTPQSNNILVDVSLYLSSSRVGIQATSFWVGIGFGTSVLKGADVSFIQYSSSFNNISNANYQGFIANSFYATNDSVFGGCNGTNSPCGFQSTTLTSVNSYGESVETQLNSGSISDTTGLLASAYPTLVKFQFTKSFNNNNAWQGYQSYFKNQSSNPPQVFGAYGNFNPTTNSGFTTIKTNNGNLLLKDGAGAYNYSSYALFGPRPSVQGVVYTRSGILFINLILLGILLFLF